MDAATTNSRASKRRTDFTADVQNFEVSARPTTIEITHCEKENLTVGDLLSPTFLANHPGVQIEITGPLTVSDPEKFESSTSALRNGTLLVVLPVEARAPVSLRFRDNLRPSVNPYTDPAFSEPVRVDDFPVRLEAGAEIKPVDMTVQPLIIARAA